MPSRVRESETQEALVHLYLRLNGYFVSSFIVHSPELGRNLTQIDALAVRHRFSVEPERLVARSPFLAQPKPATDLLICEVKSRGQPLQFNESFRESEDAIQAVLRWTGLFDGVDIPSLAGALKALLQPNTPRDHSQIGIDGPGGVTLRPLLCSPERSNSRSNQPWFIPGSEIFLYLGECLNPAEQRPSCSTRYDFNLWGTALAPLVRYFKQQPPGNPGILQGLYQFLAQETGGPSGASPESATD